MARTLTAPPGSRPSPGSAPERGRAQPDPSGGRAAPPSTVEREGITVWDFGDLPEVLDTKVAGGVVRGYPAIADAGKTAAIRVEATADAATAATRDGVLRLVLLGIPSPAAYVQEHLTSSEKLALAASPYPTAAALIEDCRRAVARHLIEESAPGGVIRTEAEFSRVRDAVSARIVDELFACVSLVAKILTRAREAERGIRSQNSLALLGTLNDIKGQLAGLVFPGFVSATGRERLAHYPRYLDGILDRLKTLQETPGKDRARLSEYERMAQAYADAGGVIPPASDSPALVEVRWLLEEYRVSLFAQRLGTAQPVSPQRIQKALSALR